MKWDLFGQILVAVLTIGAAVLQVQRGRGGRRAQLRQDLDLLPLLPDGDAKARLSSHIEASVLKLIEEETELRRDPMGITFGLIFMAAGGVIAYYGVRASGVASAALFVVAVFVGLLGIAGFTQDVVPRKRDAKGRPLK